MTPILDELAGGLLVVANEDGCQKASLACVGCARTGAARRWNLTTTAVLSKLVRRSFFRFSSSHSLTLRLQ